MVAQSPRSNRLERALPTVDVGDRQLTRGPQLAVLADVPRAVPADLRNVVGAVDRHHDLLARSPVERGDRDRVAEARPRAKRLNRRVAIVERVAPAAVAVDRERAVAMVAQSPRSNRLERALPTVDVGDRQLTRGPQLAVLADVPGAVPADLRNVVGAVDRHHDLLARSPVERGDRDRVAEARPRAKRLNRRVAIVERVAPAAIAALPLHDAPPISQSPRSNRLERALPTVDVGDRQLTRGPQLAVLADVP